MAGDNKPSFFTTLPGILTGLAALIAAIASLLAIFWPRSEPPVRNTNQVPTPNVSPVTKLSGTIERIELSQQPNEDLRVFILMSIVNEGQPTSVPQYSLRISHVSSKSIDVKGLRPLEMKERITLPKNRVTLPPRAGNKDNLIIQPQEAIVSKTAMAVPLGGKESGWMWFKLPLLTPKDISQPGIVYTVSFADVTGTPYEASYRVP